MSKGKIAVLGCGMVGGFIARTLAQQGFHVTAADADGEPLARLMNTKGITIKRADLSDAREVTNLASHSDLIIGALPGKLGFKSLETVIRAGKNTVDISFFPEDPFELDSLAKEHGVTAVVDCGVMPGLGGMAAARFAASMDRCDEISILVGGLPEDRSGKTEYKAPFSPSDVIEEYKRPARLRVNGKAVTRPALSEIETVEFPGVGTLEAFNTDGLRTLLRTMDCPDMREKTLRYPGHADKMKLLCELGFFSAEPVQTTNGKAIPLEVTSALLSREWKLRPGEPEFTAMHVNVKGVRGQTSACAEMRLLERMDKSTGDSSMARTTGLPAVAAALLIAEGKLKAAGIVPPEELGKDAEIFAAILRFLRESGISPEFSGIDL
ncbi:MAG: saccharopine dehydrogenase NADP-binding domain-containing protein [bacterium]|jgi:saccharopine dehydrogenase-like NADP-dependent oxidoreductase